MKVAAGAQAQHGRQAVCSPASSSMPQLRASFAGKPFNGSQRLARRSAAPRTAQPAPVTALFDFFKKKAAAPQAPPVLPTIVPQPSYNIPIVLAGVSGLSALTGSVVPAGISGVLAAFLAFQASRVKFIFGPEALEVRIGEQEEEFENAFVGGPNTWAYDSFVNWEFWWPGFPVLVYFKETQTKPEGQIHFFPVLFNGREVYDVMVERCGNSQTSLPAEEEEYEDEE
jgi:hypothetical protein